MEFRPCIDIHNGKVKQVVGGSLRDETDSAVENFVSEKDAAFFAEFYKKKRIRGGHVIMLNSADSPYYEETRKQALRALQAYPQGLQIGGGVTAGNAEEYVRAGASHVIVTSYVFQNGEIHYENLHKLKSEVGAQHIVLDLSCRRKGGEYVIVTDRWQKETREVLAAPLLDRLAEECDEFLIHAVDVEGKAGGIEKDLVMLLGKWGRRPVTYAGGVHDFEDLRMLQAYSGGKLNVTIGSALDLFGGCMKLEEVLDFMGKTGKQDST
ncbi:MAG: phosphoribosylformimino-5-aminoimidazole carboxamide ribotide isomerase [Lachnospiraceae bacterium]|nr:phosphoribosylformimino-5-aminoimidazole carboxamide ribotide isomerase [Lachnospiraceae bacterium]